MKKIVKVMVSLVVVAALSLAAGYAISINNDSVGNDFSTQRPCYTCNQTGKCRGCKGTGKDKAYTITGTVIIDCGACNGTGRCQYCGGDGIKGN